MQLIGKPTQGTDVNNQVNEDKARAKQEGMLRWNKEAGLTEHMANL